MCSPDSLLILWLYSRTSFIRPSFIRPSFIRPSIIQNDLWKFLKQVIVVHVIHCLLVNMGSSSGKCKQKHLIVRRHGLTTETHRQTNLTRLNQCCQCHYFLSKACFNSCKMECFIYNGGCGIRTCIEVFKRKAGLGYRKVVSLYYFLLQYPTRDLQRSYKLAIN